MTNHPLRAWRQRRGLTLAEFGELVGVNKSAVSTYENGKRCPRPQILSRIEAVTLRQVVAQDFLPDFANPIPGVSPRIDEAPDPAASAAPKPADADTLRRGAA